MKHEKISNDFATAANREKLRGRFKLMINKSLNRNTKIGKFANEPNSFYLHKQRNFLRKIDNQEKEDQEEEDEKQRELDDRNFVKNLAE